MKPSRIAAVIGTLVFLAACSSGGRQGDSGAAPSSASSVSSSPTVAAQTAIPDGIYRTRPRTEQDLVALGLTKSQIDFAKKVNEVWKKTMVYELAIKGDQFLLTGASDGAPGVLADFGTFTVDGQTIAMVSIGGPEPCDYVMRFSLSGGTLALTLRDNTCAKSDPEHGADFLVRAAYEALPFEAVS